MKTKVIILLLILCSFLSLMGTESNAQSGIAPVRSLSDCECEDEDEEDDITDEDGNPDDIEEDVEIDADGDGIGDLSIESEDIVGGAAEEGVESLGEAIVDEAIEAAAEQGMDALVLSTEAMLDEIPIVDALAIPLTVGTILYELYEADGEDLSKLACNFDPSGLGYLQGMNEVCALQLNSTLHDVGIYKDWKLAENEINSIIEEYRTYVTRNVYVEEKYVTPYIYSNQTINLDDLDGEKGKLKYLLSIPTSITESAVSEYMEAAGLKAELNNCIDGNPDSPDLESWRFLDYDNYCVQRANSTSDIDSNLPYDLRYAWAAKEVYYAHGDPTTSDGIVAIDSKNSYSFTDAFFSQGLTESDAISVSFREDYSAYLSFEDIHNEDMPDQRTLQKSKLKFEWTIPNNTTLKLELAHLEDGKVKFTGNELPYKTKLASDENSIVLIVDNYEIPETIDVPHNELIVAATIEANRMDYTVLDAMRRLIRNPVLLGYYVKAIEYWLGLDGNGAIESLLTDVSQPYMEEFRNIMFDNLDNSEMPEVEDISGVLPLIESNSSLVEFGDNMEFQYIRNEIEENTETFSIFMKALFGQLANASVEAAEDQYITDFSATFSQEDILLMVPYFLKKLETTKIVLYTAKLNDYVNQTNYEALQDENGVDPELGKTPLIYTLSQDNELSLEKAKIGHTHLAILVPQKAKEISFKHTDNPYESIQLKFADTGDGVSKWMKSYYISMDENEVGYVKQEDLQIFYVAHDQPILSPVEPYNVDNNTGTQLLPRDDGYIYLVIKNVYGYNYGDVVFIDYVDNESNRVTSPLLIASGSTVPRGYYDLSVSYTLDGQTEETYVLANDLSLGGSSSQWLIEQAPGTPRYYIVTNKTTGQSIGSQDGNSLVMGDFYYHRKFLWEINFLDESFTLYNPYWNAYLTTSDLSNLDLDGDNVVKFSTSNFQEVYLHEFSNDGWLFNRGARGLIENELTVHKLKRQEDLSTFEGNFNVHYLGANKYGLVNSLGQYLSVQESGDAHYLAWEDDYSSRGVPLDIIEYFTSYVSGYYLLKSSAYDGYLSLTDNSRSATMQFVSTTSASPDDDNYHFKIIEDNDVAPDIFLENRGYYTILDGTKAMTVLLDPMADGTWLMMRPSQRDLLISDSKTNLYISSSLDGAFEAQDLSYGDQAQNWEVYKEGSGYVLMAADNHEYLNVGYHNGGESVTFGMTSQQFSLHYSASAPDIMPSGEYIFINDENGGMMSDGSSNINTSPIVSQGYSRYNVEYIGALLYATGFQPSVSGDKLVANDNTDQNYWYFDLIASDEDLDDLNHIDSEYRIEHQSAGRFIASPAIYNRGGINTIDVEMSTEATDERFEWEIYEEDLDGTLAWIDADFPAGYDEKVVPWVWQWSVSGTVYEKSGVELSGMMSGAPASGPYTFEAETYWYASEDNFYEFIIDDQAALYPAALVNDQYLIWIDDNLVTNYKIGQVSQQFKDAIRLKAGYHHFRLEYNNTADSPTGEFESPDNAFVNSGQGIFFKVYQGGSGKIVSPSTGGGISEGNLGWQTLTNYTIPSGTSGNNTVGNALHKWTYNAQGELTNVELLEDLGANLLTNMTAGDSVIFKGTIDFNVSDTTNVWMTLTGNTNPRASLYLNGTVVEGLPDYGLANIKSGIYDFELVANATTTGTMGFDIIGDFENAVATTIVPTFYALDVAFEHIYQENVRIVPSVNSPGIPAHTGAYNPLDNKTSLKVFMDSDYNFRIQDMASGYYLYYNSSGVQRFGWGGYNLNTSIKNAFEIVPSETYNEDKVFLVKASNNNYLCVDPDGAMVEDNSDFSGVHNPYLRLLAYRENFKVYVQEDAYIRGGVQGSSTRTANYGTTDVLASKDYSDYNSAYNRIPLMKFDLSSFGEINYAVLKMIPGTITDDAYFNGMLTLKPGHDLWSEISVTCENYLTSDPGNRISGIYDSKPGLAFSLEDLANFYPSVDILNQERSADGLATIEVSLPQVNSDTRIHWYSKEAENGDKAPYMLINGWVPIGMSEIPVYVLGVLEDNDLVAHYPLDTDANDLSTYENHGIEYNGVNYVTDDIRGQVAYFDGSDDYIEIPETMVLDNTALRYTVSAWVKREPHSTPGGVVTKPYRNYSMFINAGSGYVHHRFHDGASTNSGTNSPSNLVPEGTWKYVTITNDGATAKTYVNGVLHDQEDVNGNMIADNSPVRIGNERDTNNNNIYHFKGSIDDVKIWRKALTQEEIQQEFEDTNIEVYELEPVDDTYAAMDDPNAVKGVLPEMKVQKKDNTNDTYQAYLKFDLSNVSDRVNQVVNGEMVAKLQIAVSPNTEAAAVGKGYHVRWFDDDSWNEESLTWNNMYNNTSSESLSTAIGIASGIMEWDVSSVFLMETGTEMSFRIDTGSGGFAELVLYTKETSNVDLRPKLVFQSSANARTRSTTEQVVTEELEAASLFAVYPNPTSNDFNLDFYLESADDVRLQLLDLSGRLLLQQDHSFRKPGNKSIRVEDLKKNGFISGIYLLKVQSQSLNITEVVKLKLQ